MNRTDAEWATTARMNREIAAAIARLKAGLAVSETAWLGGELAAVARQIGIGRVMTSVDAPNLADFYALTPEPSSGPEARSLPWAECLGRPPRRTRELTVSEWADLAVDAAAIHSHLLTLGDAFEPHDAKLAERWRQVDASFTKFWQRLLEVAGVNVGQAPTPTRPKRDAQIRIANDRAARRPRRRSHG